jgi:hypothetical protein
VWLRLADVATAHPELQVVLAMAIQTGLADATIAWQRNAPGEGDLALRSETGRGTSRDGARHALGGGDVSALLAAACQAITWRWGVTGRTSAAPRGSRPWRPMRCTGRLGGAKEYVATHRDAWAVLPWAVGRFPVGMVPGRDHGTALARYLVLSGPNTCRRPWPRP